MLPHIQGGYYDKDGKWIRQKYCLLPCRDCNCMPPGGVWQKGNKMSIVTGEQVRDAMMKANVTRVLVHNCSMCNYPCSYVRSDDELNYDSGCDCTGRYVVEYRQWEDAADLINMQSNEQVRLKLKKAFGFPVITLRQAHENAAGMGLENTFFVMNGINPDELCEENSNG